MYNNGFGAYPQDDMDMGVNSYFGESDTNFFGDTSNDSFFGEGCGFTGVGNGEFFNESVGFSTDGSEVISEACDTGFGYSDTFMESSNVQSSMVKAGVAKHASKAASKEQDPDKADKFMYDARKKAQASMYSSDSPSAAKKRLENGNYLSREAVQSDMDLAGVPKATGKYLLSSATKSDKFRVNHNTAAFKHETGLENAGKKNNNNKPNQWD